MSTFRKVSFLSFMAFIVLCLPQRLIADPPETLVSDYVDGLSLTIQGTNLYWKTDCGDDFSPANSRLRSIATNRGRAGDPSADNIAHTLFFSSNRCEEGPTRNRAGDRIASMNVAVDAMYVYWVSGNGVVVRLSRNAMPGVAPTVLALTENIRIARYPNVPSIAVDDRYVYWSEVNKIFRAPKAGGDARLVTAGGTLISNLRSGGDGTVYYLDASRLRLLAYDRVHDGYLPTNLADGAVAYALNNERIYWASRGQGAYMIASRRRDRSDYRVHFESSTREVSEHPNQRVDTLALDATNVYWHVVVDRSGGPIVRMALSGGAPTPISDNYVLLNTELVSDGDYLLWADSNSRAIYRLPISASATHPTTSAGGPIFNVTDVSPDRPFGSPYDGGGDPAGKIVSVVVDPRSAGVVYAASEFSGVWKSVNGARTWFQSSRGLMIGTTAVASGLAVDEVDSRRLLYAAADNDFRPMNPFGGLWTSTDGAASWRHVDLPGCSPSPTVYSLTFGAGHAFVITHCGVYTSTDLMNWITLPSPPATSAVNWIAARGQTIFVTTGDNKLYRSTLGALFMPDGTFRTDGNAWGTDISLPGTSFGLAVAPTNSSTEPAVLVLHASGQQLDVSLANFDVAPGTSQLQSLGFNRGGQCCGFLGIFAARRASARVGDVTPGSGFDIFVSSGHDFYQYQSTANWQVLGGMHVDTWGMAFPSNYDPERGNCTAYVANDGGVYANTFATRSTSPATCITHSGPWGRAQSGLHAFGSYGMAGIHQPSYGGLPYNALYVGSGDNGTWMTTNEGADNWTYIGCCGDSGFVTVDPLLTLQVMTGRNGFRQIYRVSRFRGVVPERDDSNSNVATDDMYDGDEPPAQPAVSQIMTLPGERGAPENGDYLSLQSPSRITGRTGDDMVVRRYDGGSWEDVSPRQHFPPATVNAIASSNGHRNPVIYVLKKDGTISKGQVDSSGRVPSWANVTNQITSATDIFVNPYNQNEAYVTDSGAHDIKVTLSGGSRWETQTRLTDIATQNGAFTFACQDKFCPLQAMLFVVDHPEIRVAILFPGNFAFSRDGGVHWIPIGDNLNGLGGLDVRRLSDLIAHPYSGFIDMESEPGTGNASLYLALRGRSMVRLDGPFATLEQLEFEFDPDRMMAHAGRAEEKVVAINETTGVITELHRGAGGIYRGTELVDAAGHSTIRYRIVADGKSRAFSHTLTPAERTSGIASFGMTVETPAEPKMTIDKIFATPKVLGYGSCRELPTVITVQGHLSVVERSDSAAAKSAAMDFERVVLRYRYVSDSTGLKPGPWLEKAMKDAGGGSYVVAFDVSGEASEVLQKTNGAIEYQTLLGDERKSSPIEKIEIQYCPEAIEKEVNELPKSAVEFQVTGVSLKAEIEKFYGPCPAALKFAGSVTVNASGTVKYSFLRSDGAMSPVETLHFDSAGTRTVSTVWTLGGPDLTTYEGWQVIRILSPNVIESDKASFVFQCEKGSKP